MLIVLKEELHDRNLAKALIGEIQKAAEDIGRELKIMEVCGTHTVSLRRSGIHSFLPDNITMISGPGCPVCVTPAGYVDNALSLLEEEELTLATFGDMLKVPGSGGISLSRYIGSGRVRIIYSPSDLISMAQSGEKPIVFLGIGFETTIPTIASVFLRAFEQGIHNLFLYPAFKTVPPALQALLSSPDRNFDAFLLPGHVSVILGLEPYRLLEKPGGVPGVITGFEPIDLLGGILSILKQLRAGENKVENAYPRAVRREGNPRAREIMNRLLQPSDELWRGLGIIPLSGMRLKAKYMDFDAGIRFGLPEIRNFEPPGCICAQVIQGKALPNQCSLFGKNCTPDKPVGPCMVSSEGSCAANFRYRELPV